MDTQEVNHVHPTNYVYALVTSLPAASEAAICLFGLCLSDAKHVFNSSLILFDADLELSDIHV